MGHYKLSRIAILGAVAAGIFILPGRAFSSPYEQQSVDARAAAAKTAGKTEVTFASLTNTYPTEPKGLTHALAQFTVVVATPRRVQSVQLEDGTAIGTWYSVDIQETIANHACTMCALLTLDHLPGTVKPTSLLPVPPHSMIFVRRGGSLRIDGVEVTETEKDVATLSLRKKYLFVVDKAKDGIARLVLNDAGIFVVGDDGNTLTPLNKRPAGAPAVSFPTLTELRRTAAKPEN